MRVFSSSASISLGVTRCSRGGPTDTVPEFIALLTCADWEKLCSEGAIKSEPIHDAASENRDRVALPSIVRSWNLHRLNCTRRIRAAAKNERHPGEESRDCAARLDCSVKRFEVGPVHPNRPA